jgi:hypothetical protein
LHITLFLISFQKIVYCRIVFLLILFSIVFFDEYESPQFIFAHFFGATKNIGNYQLVFAPYPALPLAGDNSTLLNFSILDKNNHNVNNIFASLIIKNKINGSIVQNFPLKFYEFSDITFPYTFKEIGDYQVSLLIKINGDPTYSQTPISVDFDLSATNPNQIIPTDELIIYYAMPALAVIAGIVVYLRRKNKI